MLGLLMTRTEGETETRPSIALALNPTAMQR
jgi:hypothetical protein